MTITKKSNAAKRKNTTTENTQHVKNEIAKLAYQLYVDRGCVHGCDKDDWHRAEQLYRNQQSMQE